MLLRLHCGPSEDIHTFLSVSVEWLVLLLLFRNVLASNSSCFYIQSLPQSVYANNRLVLQILL